MHIESFEVIAVGKLKRYLFTAMIGLAVVIMILDSSVAFQGAEEGLQLCVQTVIPSLFPLMFLMTIMVSLPEVNHFPFCKRIGKLFHIPEGCETILLTGLLGGYPLGAVCVGQAVSEGRLSSGMGSRMIVFCNAAGPAFIFGIAAGLFEQRWIGFLLWGIQILSCLYISGIMASQDEVSFWATSPPAVSFSKAMSGSIKSISMICGWIIMMRILIAILEQHILYALPLTFRIFIRGVLELSNGCISLYEVSQPDLRFLVVSAFLGFGGLCVALQSCSAAKSVSAKRYLPGKLLQGIVSFLMALIVQPFVFGGSQTSLTFSIGAGFSLIAIKLSVYGMKKIKNRGRILEFVGV